MAVKRQTAFDAARVGDGRSVLARVLMPSYDTSSKHAAFRFRCDWTPDGIVPCPSGADGRPKAKQQKHRKHSLSRPRPVLTFGFQVCPGFLSVFCLTEQAFRKRSGVHLHGGSLWVDVNAIHAARESNWINASKKWHQARDETG